ncbi:MAG: ABC transporter substrate-binding protein [Acidimicrobiales bacterium]
MSTGGPTGGGGAGGGAAAGGTAAAACGTGQIGRGVTANTISIGFDDFPDVSQANAGIGGNQWTSDEPKSDGQAFVKYFNETGGLCGRQIVPVWAEEKVVSGSTSDQADQAACTTWTQDNTIFAAMDFGNFRPARLDCLAKAGVLALDVGTLLTTDTNEATRYFKLLLQPYKITLDRFFPAYVDQLAAQGFFHKGAKVGLLYTDIPAEQRAIDRTLIPALKAKGITLADQAKVTHTYNIDTLAASESQTNSAVLKFQSDGVSEVLAPVDGYSLMAFAGRANQQNYSPRYALSTSDQQDNRGGMGQSAIWTAGTVDVVWLPALSWAEAQTNPGTQTCLGFLAKEGHRPPHDQGVLDLSYCDTLTFLRATLGRSQNLTPDGVSAAAATLGPQANGDLAWQWQMTATRHDGVGAVRVAAYGGGANGQWRYVTPLTPIA